MKHLLPAVLLTMAIAGCSEETGVGVEPTTTVSFARDAGLRVMTRNLYIGASTDPVITAQPQDVPFRAAEAFEQFLSNNFADRMAALAEEIAGARPHLVGLQEVTVMRRQSPGDLLIGNPTPATDVVADFEATLLSELAALGLDYRIVARIQNTDVELPMFVGFGEGVPLLDDLRITDFDMILARHDVQVSNVTEENFAVFIQPGFDLLRGWVAVDATVRGTTYRFVNTHLEAFNEQVRLAQADELVRALADEPHPVIAVGDFNTEATDGAGAAYRFMDAAGYEDVWPLNRARGRRSGGPGFACCHAPDLLAPTTVDRRIDLIFVRDGSSPTSPSLNRVAAEVLGESLDDRIVVGEQLIWPSDHAGVFAELKFRRKSDKSDKSDRSGKSGKSGKSDRSGKSGKSDRSGKSGSR